MRHIWIEIGIEIWIENEMKKSGIESESESERDGDGGILMKMAR